MPGCGHTRWHIGIIGLLWMMVGTARAMDLSDVTLPVLHPMPGESGQWISERMAVNGLPMSIYGFATARDVAAVQAHYEQDLRARGVKVYTERRGAVQTVAGADERHHYSVQIQQHGNESEVLLVVSARPDLATLDRSIGLPLPMGVEVTGKYQYLDAGQAAESIDIVADRGAYGLSRALQGRLEHDGWTLIMASPMRGEVTGWVAEFQRNSEQLQAQLMDQPGGRTHGMIHWRR